MVLFQCFRGGIGRHEGLVRLVLLDYAVRLFCTSLEKLN